MHNSDGTGIDEWVNYFTNPRNQKLDTDLLESGGLDTTDSAALAPMLNGLAKAGKCAATRHVTLKYCDIDDVQAVEPLFTIFKTTSSIAEFNMAHCNMMDDRVWAHVLPGQQINYPPLRIPTS